MLRFFQIVCTVIALLVNSVQAQVPSLKVYTVECPGTNSRTIYEFFPVPLGQFQDVSYKILTLNGETVSTPELHSGGIGRYERNSVSRAKFKIVCTGIKNSGEAFSIDTVVRTFDCRPLFMKSGTVDILFANCRNALGVEPGFTGSCDNITFIAENADLVNTSVYPCIIGIVPKRTPRQTRDSSYLGCKLIVSSQNAGVLESLLETSYRVIDPPIPRLEFASEGAFVCDTFKVSSSEPRVLGVRLVPDPNFSRALPTDAKYTIHYYLYKMQTTTTGVDWALLDDRELADKEYAFTKTWFGQKQPGIYLICICAERIAFDGTHYPVCTQQLPATLQNVAGTKPDCIMGIQYVHIFP
jgi:hypothetical protein